MSYKVDTIAIRKIMAEKEICSITELSRITGISRETLSGVLKGIVRPSTMVIDKLCSTLDIEPSKAGAIFFMPDLRNT